jgi:hypothetical protein
MNKRSPSPVLAALVALLVVMLLGIVMWLAPYGIDEIDRNWLEYRSRGNPKCLRDEDCLAMSCPPPNGVTCWRRDEGGRYGSTCICRPWGLRPKDAGSDGSP